MQMLTKATFHDLANAQNFQAAADLLSSTEYSMSQSGRSFTEIENILSQRRLAVRQLFEELIIDKPFVYLFRSRDDFTNLRLAVRRTLTEKPVGNDYSTDGNIPPELFEEVFEQERYNLFPGIIYPSITG